jgi:hypothetical protein
MNQTGTGALVGEGVQHGEHGRQADAAAEEDDRARAVGLEKEVAAGRADLEDVAGPDAVVEVIGDDAGGRRQRLGRASSRLTLMR